MFTKSLIRIICVIAMLGFSQSVISGEKSKKVKIPDGSITTVMLADGVVTIDKLSPEIVDSIDEVELLKQRIDALEELVNMQHQAMQNMLGCIDPTSDSLKLIFDGCDVHVRNGSGTSESANALGNLIIGYNEDSGDNSRMGSHNLIIGPSHNYDWTNGIIAGNDTAMIELENGQATVTAETVDINSVADINVKSDLGNIIVLGDVGDITIKSPNGKVELKALQSAELKVGASNLKVEPNKIMIKSVQTTVEAAASLNLKSSLTTIEAAGILDLKGALVKLGDSGGMPVARVGDTIIGTAGPYSVIGTITSGSASVLAK